MFSVVSVRGNSVRVRCGLIVIDVKVHQEATGKRVELPSCTRVDNFKTLVGMVLQAYEDSITGENVTSDNTTRKTG
jgi:hypothetical protein